MRRMRRIGLIGVSDERKDAHERLAPLIEEHTSLIAQVLEDSGEAEVIRVGEPINSPRTACEQGKELAARNVEGVIFSLPTFGFPRLGILAAQFAPAPYLLVTKPNDQQPAPAGFLGVGGAMTQLGISHERLWDDPASETGRETILRFARVASALNGLRGQVLGIFGGRSMGLYPMTASGSEVMRTFGVDLDHIDQLEIVRLADEIDDSEVKEAYDWLEKHVASIEYSDILTREKLETQIRHLISTIKIIEDREFDFVGIKCHTEMSAYQVPQCLSTCLLNDPYDWRGDRMPIMTACEADVDGALTMQILHMITGLPSCLLDLRYFDKEKEVVLFQNCGSAPSYFAGHSDEAEKNLAKVSLRPCVAKFRGGGAHVRFDFRPGAYTLARLHHSPEGYVMTIAEAETVLSEGSVPGAESNWPLAVMKLEAGQDQIRDKLHSVHLHAVPGRHTKELQLFSRFLGMQSVLLSKE